MARIRLKAAGHRDEAQAAYGRALDVVKTMEPEAQEVWGPAVEKR